MEEDEHDHGLELCFHGLEPILGTIYEFSCGTKSAGKYPGFNEEDEDVPPSYWTVQISRFIFFIFSGI